jgi:hypothetical protein
MCRPIGPWQRPVTPDADAASRELGLLAADEIVNKKLIRTA